VVVTHFQGTLLPWCESGASLEVARRE